jgi:hypothetical protein
VRGTSAHDERGENEETRGNPVERLDPGEKDREVQESRHRPTENGRHQEPLLSRAAEVEKLRKEKPGEEVRESESGERFQEHR